MADLRSASREHDDIRARFFVDLIGDLRRCPFVHLLESHRKARVAYVLRSHGGDKAFARELTQRVDGKNDIDVGVASV